MNYQDLNVRLEPSPKRVSWRGTLVSFARANSLSAGQMTELHDELVQHGVAQLVSYEAQPYMLRRV